MTDLDEVLLQHIVQGRVQLLPDVLQHEGPAQGHGVLQVLTEILVVQGGHLGAGGKG